MTSDISSDLKIKLISLDGLYGRFCNYIIQDVNLFDLLEQSAYGFNGPLSYPGGLLKHTVKMIEELTILQNDNDLMLLGATLRNIGWSTCAYRRIIRNERRAAIDSEFAPTLSYSLLGVDICSIKIVHDLCISAESDINLILSDTFIVQLEHLCKRNPITPEGKLLKEINKYVDKLFGIS